MLLSVCVYRKQCMLSSGGDHEENINPEEVAKKVKDAAKIIRETSSTAGDTLRKFHESGAISELAGAVQEAAAAAQDTATEIKDTAEEVRDSHVASDTARAVEETATTTAETIQAVQDTARQIPKAAPNTYGSTRKGAAKTRKTVNTTT